MNLSNEESAVSRFHCEMKPEQKGARARSPDERPGTYVDGVRWRQSRARGRSGSTGAYPPLRHDARDELPERRQAPPGMGPDTGESMTPPPARTAPGQATFGDLVATSAATRASFERMACAAACNATVLLEGETGTGKSRAAHAIHRAGARANAPFLVVDCGALPANLLESELFGHEKGAFTGAVQRRVGAFEEADGGTIFLDEIGELPAELQPKLLRVLENREIRRLGTNTYQPVNVRVIAATHRDLREEVQAGRFRADLYFRLAVVGIPIPSLRERTEDIPLIVERILVGLGATPEQLAKLTTPDFLARLQRAAWPGNVRELRNHLERCLVFQSALPPTAPDALAPAAPRAVDPSLTYAESRRRALESFERDYVEALLKLHGGKVSQAAAAADMDRVYLYRLLRRHGLKS
ncbi:sigma-54 interaction domain-containing protein [Corallococcus aberystwythensis]|uniref:Sigma-54-dependent Fis family transcriptional regulator n=1 Tax=Corallococcus aberystwythensis TaxID=2316722 RepID=A0A3A8QEP4_9BACT|nr:sigma-54 dependent transcriptional regulator [Corallococcus aberystwythensis]RKH67183.1 sigma-54-dependent Fis family transcriptional regulator [Corallococcus aberystwythensis]